MKRYLIIFFLLLSVDGISQNRNSVWCFGDSVGMDFSAGSPTLFTSSLKSRGSAVSVSDTLGQLLFYAYTRATVPGNTARVINKNHVLMSNGDNVVGEAWYQELVIIPDPGNEHQYYLFSVGETGGGGSQGLYYSVIDMSLDSNRGAITIKNMQMQSYKASDDLIAIRHGNGRDWWLISRRWDTSNDEFYEYLITPYGVDGPFILHEGDNNVDGLKWISVSKSGNKFVCYDPAGMIQVFDFDRCTGNMTLNATVSHNAPSAPYPFYWGAEFSPSEQLLYVSKYTDSIPLYPTYLIQFDLNAPNIFASADTLWNYAATPVAAGKLKLAPDGKIYFSCIYNDGTNFPYPYPDSTFNLVNNNLSVINYPDSPGVACGFTPFSFNLGAGRCYIGLPNNPDYELGPIVNSICDTVLAVNHEPLTLSSALHVFYHTGWQIAFINAMNLKGKKCLLTVFDLTGRMVYKEERSMDSGYFTKDLDCAAFANGLYIVTLQTDREKLVQRFVKE